MNFLIAISSFLFRSFAGAQMLGIYFGIALWINFFIEIMDPLDLALLFLLLIGLTYFAFNFFLEDWTLKIFLKPLARILQNPYKILELISINVGLTILNLVIYIPYFVINPMIPRGYKIPRLLPSGLYRS